MLYSLWQKIYTILFQGAHCVLCLSTEAHLYSLCESCIVALPWIKRGCQGCGLPLRDHALEMRCAPCILYALPFDRVKVAFEYKWPCDQFIAQIKFKKKLEFVQILGHLMAEHFKKDLEEKPDCLIPVPLHIQRLKERGFNQAYVLAQIIGRKLNIPVVWNAVKKTKQTRAQSSLSLEERGLNLQSVFEVNSDFSVHFNHVAIIDDVMTTGQTVSSLTRALKVSGIRRVEVWCCCRTLKAKS